VEARIDRAKTSNGSENGAQIFTARGLFSDPTADGRPSQLDPFKTIILGWLAQDARVRYKQRHTAQRIHERLLHDYPETYQGSYSTVQRFVQKATRKAPQEGTLELVWHPGEMPVDFGTADATEYGAPVVLKFLTMTFPFSNAGYYQSFRGETAECVVQGLQDIFEHIGGVPRRLVFDNASGVGRRVHDQVRLTTLFQRFQSHYGFETTFCNPYAGHEKGNVENKVGYTRRHFFVPAWEVDDLVRQNQTALVQCEADWDRRHYKKGSSIATLWQAERSALRALPLRSMTAVRFTRALADGYGKVQVDGVHWYSTAPEFAGQELMLQIGAHTVTPFAPDGTPITCHPRPLGTTRTDTADYRTTVHQLWQKPGAWRNSGLRALIPETARTLLDDAPRADLKDVLHALADLTERYDFEHAVHALVVAVSQGRPTYATMMVCALRAAADPASLSNPGGPDLSAYDQFLDGRGSV
jgi:transposase